MIHPVTVIENIRTFIDVPSVNAIVSAIISGEPPLSVYTELGNLKQNFIIINSLPVTFGRLQKGVANINMYAPDVSCVADKTALNLILQVVKPLVEDAGDGYFFTDIGNGEWMQLLKEPAINYHFYNLRVQVFGANEITQNFV